MSAGNFRAPVTIGTDFRDARCMLGDAVSRLGPKKGGGRAVRRAQQRELRRQGREQQQHHITGHGFGQEVAGG